MPEIGTSGLMSGDGKRGDGQMAPKLPRPSSTLPYRPFALRHRCDAAWAACSYQSPRRCSGAPSPAADPLRHQHDGLAVDLGVIPFAHRHLEIRRARGKRRAGLPAVGLEQISGRGQHIWNGMAQIDMAVAAVVDAVLDV